MLPWEKLLDPVWNQGPLLVVAGLILYAGYKHVWVWGRDAAERLEELRKDRDEWKTLALRSASLVDRATTVVANQQALVVT